MPTQKNNPSASPSHGDDDVERADKSYAYDEKSTGEDAPMLSPEEELEAYARAVEERQAEPSGETLARLEELETQVEEAIAARQRAQADFANYQRRALENETRALKNGATSVIKSILPVLDHFDLALNQTTEQVTVVQLLDGVRMVRTELMKALESQKLSIIQPKLGDEFDPSRHQAVRIESTDEYPPNSIVSVMQVGYAYEDQVLRPSCVAVAAAPGDTEN